MSTDSFAGYFAGFDPSYNLIFSAGWSDWEEGGWLFIFEKDGQAYSIEGGHCVMTGTSEPSFPEDLEPLSQDEALAMMLEWEPNENTEDFEWDWHRQRIEAAQCRTASGSEGSPTASP